MKKIEYWKESQKQARKNQKKIIILILEKISFHLELYY